MINDDEGRDLAALKKIIGSAAMHHLAKSAPPKPTQWQVAQARPPRAFLDGATSPDRRAIIPRFVKPR